MSDVTARPSLNLQGNKLDANLQSKLKNPEAQKILAVVQEIQRKMSLMVLLPEKVDGRFSMVFGEEFSAQMTKHRELELELDRLYAQQQIEATEEVHNEIKEVVRVLRASTRTLCRLAALSKSNNTIIPKLRHLNPNKHQAVTAFEDKIQEMKVVLFDRLRTSIEEERARQNQITVTMNKEARTNQEVAVLSEELRKAKELRSNEISKKDEVIKDLKSTLRDIKMHAEESTNRMESRSKQKEELDRTQSLSRAHQIELEMRELAKNLESVQAANREEEAAMRKKKAKIENEVEAWISKYDQDMDEKQNEFDELFNIYTEEHSNLEDLQRRNDELSKYWQGVLDERARLAEMLKKKAQELIMLNKFASRIQAVWRGFVVRREMKKAKGKKDKKGGKKK